MLICFWYDHHMAGAEGAHTPQLWPGATCTGASEELCA